MSRWTNKRARNLVRWVGVVQLLVFGCIGCDMKSDAVLERVFVKNTADFAALAKMSVLDARIQRLQVRPVKPRDMDMPDERWREYQRLFHKLGITQGMEHPYNHEPAVYFYVECQGSAISRDCKGYAYSNEPLAPTKDSLNKLAPGVSFKPLSQHWYLFRDGG